MSNEELVIRIKSGDNTADNMLQLYNQVKAFIHTIAWLFRGHEDIEDLEQEGYLALYAAIDGYDPDQGVKFLTYASWHIRQRMQRYITDKGSCLRLSVGRNEKVQQYKRLCSQFKMEYGREPTNREAAYYLEQSLEQIENIKAAAVASRLGSLDTPITGTDGGEGGTVGDLVADPEQPEDDILNRIQQEQLKAVIWDCVDGLGGRQPDIIRKRYIEGKSLREIGEEYGVNGEAIRQQERKGLHELRKPRNSSRLRPYLDDAWSSAMTGVGVDRFRQTWTSATEREALRRV